MIATCIVVAVFVTLVLLTLVVAKKNWSEITLKYYTWKWYWAKRHGSERVRLMGDETKTAYVLYRAEDELDKSFVQKELIDMVEHEWDMSLHIPERDSEVGTARGDGIVSDMDSCRCIIIIFSGTLWKENDQDEWLEFALNHASNIRRSGLRSKVCIIRVGDIPTGLYGCLKGCVVSCVHRHSYQYPSCDGQRTPTITNSGDTCALS